MTAMPLLAAKRELAAASRALQTLKSATDLSGAEEAWRTFLHHLDRVWQKVEASCKTRSSKFQPWQGAHARARRKDMLLRYLHHARNSDEHTITEVVTQQPGAMHLGPPEGASGVMIKSLTIDQGPRGVEVRYGGSPIEVRFTGPRLRLEKVYDRGEWYNPPTLHLGQPLANAEPANVGDLGLRYYSEFLADAERTFFQ